MAQASGKPYPKLKRGHGVYMRQCAQCHEHRIPSSATLPEWHDKVSAMSMRAGISKEEERDLQIYLGEFSDR
jgi:cytochrome c5